MMLPWCSTMGVTGWLVMIAGWATFVALSVWAISRLIPVSDGSEAATQVPEELTADRVATSGR